MTWSRRLPDPEEEPTITIPRAARILGVSVRTGYAMAERGEWPTIRLGRRTLLPTARWLRTVGLVEEARNG